jgi:hypothetical protein
MFHAASGGGREGGRTLLHKCHKAQMPKAFRDGWANTGVPYRHANA